MDSSAVNAIKILVVDDDSTCLAVVAAVLRKWNYQVATVKDPMEALINLRMEGGFDLVVADVHMPEMNGFQLQQLITTEFHLPVVLMSVDDKDSLVAKGVDFGATLFISKPVSVNDVRDLWQIAASNKKEQNSNRVTAAPVCGSDVVHEASVPDQASTDNPDDKKSEIIKDGDVTFKTHKITGKKKLVWTATLHYKFLEAINIIGLNNAVPKKILDVMDVPGITRENIASHLQKYRIFLRRVSEVTSAIQRNVDWRNAGRANLRPRNIAGRRLGMFSQLINEQRFRAGQTSFGRNMTVAQPPMRPAAAFSLFSNYRQASPPNQALPGYGQSSLLSPQRYNLGQSPLIPTNVVNPIYPRNFTSLPPLVIRGNNAITSPPPPPTVQGGGGRLPPQTYAAGTRNEMLMGARPNHMMSGRVEVPDPLDFDFLFDDDDVFNFLLSDPTENVSQNSSNPSSAVTQGGNPLSPLFVADTTDQPQTNLTPAHPISTGGDESSSLLTPLSMFDGYFADHSLDAGLGDLFSSNVVNSNFSSAVNQTPQYQDLPRFDQFVEPRNDEEFLESVFASMPFVDDEAENRQDHTFKN